MGGTGAGEVVAVMAFPASSSGKIELEVVPKLRTDMAVCQPTVWQPHGSRELG